MPGIAERKSRMKLTSWFVPALVGLLFFVAACGGSERTPADDGPADGVQPTADGGEAPVDGDPAPSGFELFAPFAGRWQGTWNNETFSTSAAVTIDITVSEDGTASFTIDLPATDTGAPFGLATIALPKTLTGTFDAGGLIVVVIGDELFGDMTVRITADGALTAQASMEPLLAISGLVVEGTVAEGSMDFTYIVTFSDSTTASGTATLTKS